MEEESHQEESSKPKFRVIEGRRHHNLDNSKYFLAGDEAERNRLNEGHKILRSYWKANFVSPVEDMLRVPGAKILDVGCAGGAWILDVAEAYPSAHFTGIDISSIFPRTNLPENVEFIEANMLDGLKWPDDTFTFIHQRALIAGYTQEQWQKNVIPELVRVLKPGGWLEFCEWSIVSSDGPAPKKFAQAYSNILLSRGMYDNVGPHLKGFFESNPKLIDISQKELEYPIGDIGGEPGRMLLKNLTDVADAAKPALFPALKLQDHEWDRFVQQFAKELNEYRSSSRGYRVYAQKSS